MKQEFTYWVEDHPTSEYKFHSVEETIKAAQTAYDEKDEDELYWNDVTNNVNHIINIGIVEYLDIDDCIGNIMNSIDDNEFSLIRCEDFVNDALSDLCYEAEWEAERNDEADKNLNNSVSDFLNGNIDKDNLRYKVKTWVEIVTPAVWAALPLDKCYNLKEHKWI